MSSSEVTMQNGHSKKKLEVSVIGGGLVGALEALFLAKRGHTVHIYEYREDIRRTPQMRGRSINLALSARGRRALRHVGLEEQVVGAHGIPMRARMIHRLDGTTYAIPYDTVNNQCIYSVGRNYLNALLLKESEKYPNVHRHFNHKLTEVNLEKGTMKFLQTDSKATVEVSSELIVGADGAHSAVRRALVKRPLVDYSQQYIEHGYLELCVPPSSSGGFQMPANYLHIWPRGTFMMIALPNQDCSWTVTLFMPFAMFRELRARDALLAFFARHFPDAVALIGEERLVEDFFAGTPSPLVAIKCRPYHVTDKAVLLGDAAHAVVPFYGQGMNAGFEDCLLLDGLLERHGGDLARALHAYSESRWRDAHAVSDLAMYNYIEMRELVTRASYRARRAVDSALQRLAPRLWLPLYSSVTFSDLPYSQCVANRRWQDQDSTTVPNMLASCRAKLSTRANDIANYKTMLTRAAYFIVSLVTLGVFFTFRSYF